jgi:ubiquinone/menaquinone biosynthesis C-methylase UbiE
MNYKEEQSIRSYNKKAGNYENTYDGKFTSSFKEELINKVALKENYKVLDVACGTGTLLNGLMKKCPIDATGIDISDKMIAVAKSKYSNINFFVSSCVPLGFENDTFDVITVSAAFHHFPYPSEFAKEAYRVLKSKSRIYIAEVSMPNIIRQIFNVIALPLIKAGDVKIYSSKELRSIFEQAGFINISIEKRENIQFLQAEKR